MYYMMAQRTEQPATPILAADSSTTLARPSAAIYLDADNNIYMLSWVAIYSAYL